MAGRDEPQGPDVDDWFDEPQPPRAGRTQATSGESEDDWIGASTTRRTPRRPSVGFLGDFSGRGRAIAVVAVSAVVLLIAILAIAGVFSSSNPPAESLTLGTTTATQPTTTQKTTTTSATTVPAPSVPLKPGDTGAQVEVLQTALVALGYDPGKVDGDYGTATTNAVIAFQKASGLTADGVVGPQTRAALHTALANL
jgi:hypothetical protein